MSTASLANTFTNERGDVFTYHRHAKDKIFAFMARTDGTPCARGIEQLMWDDEAKTFFNSLGKIGDARKFEDALVDFEDAIVERQRERNHGIEAYAKADAAVNAARNALNDLFDSSRI